MEIFTDVVEHAEFYDLNNRARSSLAPMQISIVLCAFDPPRNFAHMPSTNSPRRDESW